MFCSKCGAQINDYAEVCMHCGCETSNAKNKQATNDFQSTENTLKLVFVIIFIVVFVISFVSTIAYLSY